MTSSDSPTPGIDEKWVVDVVQGAAYDRCMPVMLSPKTLLHVVQCHVQQRWRGEAPYPNLFNFIRRQEVKLDGKWMKLEEKVGREWNELEDYLAALCPVRYECEQDRKRFEGELTFACSCLSLPFTPRLVWETGAWVWDV